MAARVGARPRRLDAGFDRLMFPSQNQRGASSAAWGFMP
jgi:hypothetical protein